MADENNKPNIGSISIKDGKWSIVVDKHGKTEAFGIDFVCRRMLAVAVATKSPYANNVRSIVADLRAYGLRAIPNAMDRLNFFKATNQVKPSLATKFAGVSGVKMKVIKGKRELNDITHQFPKWVDWLGQIERFKNVRTGKHSKPAWEKFEENWTPAFANENKQVQVTELRN